MISLLDRNLRAEEETRLKTDYDLIIIGGGPAGLTAGMYASRGGLNTLLIEKNGEGGPLSITEWIENYPGFPEGVGSHELMERMRKQAERFGLKIEVFCCVTALKSENGVKKVVVDTDEGAKELSSKAIIITTGSSPRRLEIPGEKEFTGKGVSYCATCDGPLFKDKKLLVVGGGNAAIEEALDLTKFASKVTIVHRRDKLRADKILQDRAFASKKIAFLFNSELEEIQGTKMVERVVILNNKTGERQIVEADGVFVYVGNTPNTDFARGVLQVDENGYIITNENLQTSVEGIFAAGDVRKSRLRQIATAVGDGALAAVMAERYLEDRKGG
jgi:thioredoxin reductase (NADPH)